MNALQRAWNGLKSAGLWQDEVYGFPRVPWEADIADYRESHSAHSAFNISAVWSAVRVLSEDMASLPLIVYRRQGEGKERDQSHFLYEVLHDFANPEMTSFQWRETMMSHLLTWGNCYSEKVYDRAGRLQLYPLRPDRMEVRWANDGTRAYWYTREGERKLMKPDSVFHVSGLSWDGLVGYSPVTLARRSLSIAHNADAFADSFIRKGASQRVVLQVPRGYPDNLRTKLMEAWSSKHDGPGNAGRTAMLEEGVVATTLSMNLDDAQFLQTREFQITEIARWFRIPPDKIGDLEHATYSNIEQQELNYVIHSLRPWLVRWEQAIKLQLMRDDREHFCEFLMDALLRGDAKSRADAFNVQLRSGALTLDEWRAAENRNAYPDKIGQEPFISVDLKPVMELLNPPPPPVAEPAAPPVDNTGPALALIKSFRDEAAEERSQAAEERASILARWERSNAASMKSQRPIQIDAPVTVQPAEVTVNVPPQPAAQVNVNVPEPPEPRPVTKMVKRDTAGRITEIVEV